MARGFGDQGEKKGLKLGLVEQTLAASAPHGATATAPEAAPKTFAATAATTSPATRKTTAEALIVVAERTAAHAESASAAHAVGDVVLAALAPMMPAPMMVTATVVKTRAAF